jgi:hypothetical protein
VIPFFTFPPEIRRPIHTTNAIESVNGRLRKIIKTRGHFPTDDAASKLTLAFARASLAGIAQHHGWMGKRGPSLEGGDEPVRGPLCRALPSGALMLSVDLATSRASLVCPSLISCSARSNRGSSPCSPPGGAARGSGPAAGGEFDRACARCRRNGRSGRSRGALIEPRNMDQPQMAACRIGDPPDTVT